MDLSLGELFRLLWCFNFVAKTSTVVVPPNVTLKRLEVSEASGPLNISVFN